MLIGGYFGTWHDIGEVARPAVHGRRAAAGRRLRPALPSCIVLPAAGCGLAEAARILSYLASQSAQQCGPCMFGLPAIADDLAQLAAARPEGDPLGRMQRRFGQIAGRGACHHPDGAVRMAASALRTFAADAHAHARRRTCLAAQRPPSPPGAVRARPRAGDWR